MSRHPSILDPSNAVLLLIDVQEAFRKVLKSPDQLAHKVNILIDAANILRVPVVVTEQYPKGLGSTFEEIKSHLGDHELFEKDCFSACGIDAMMNYFGKSGRKQILVSGIEAHVCVCQTSLDLLKNDYQVHLITDAIDSRIPENKAIGIQKILSAGGIPSCVEMALFEMLKESGTDEFKAVQKLVK